MEKVFQKQSFAKKVKSMLKVDFRRMAVTPFFYILLAISFAVPILILVMTGMMEGTTSINPQTGLPSQPMQGFDYVWQMLGAVSSSGADASAGMSMDLVSMCNINMMLFACSVLVCLFITGDFKSGYAKNLFTVRANKIDYVVSKTVVCTLGSALMVLCFVLGMIIGGAGSGTSFALNGVSASNIVFCVLSKIFLLPTFVSIFTVMSVVAKQKTWLAVCLSLGTSMLLFMMIPVLSPLDATILNAVICLLSGIIFAVGLGAVSNLILNKTSLV